MNDSYYFNDLLIFIKFLFMNKFIFLLSFVIISIFVFNNYYSTYQKHLNSYSYESTTIEILKSQKGKTLNNNDLLKYYKFPPYKKFTNDEYNIHNILKFFNDDFVLYLKENKISYKLIDINKNNLKYELYNQNIDEETLLKIYNKYLKYFISNLQYEINYIYESKLREIYSYINNIRLLYKKVTFNEALEIYNRFGGNYIFQELCKLNSLEDSFLPNKNIYICALKLKDEKKANPKDICKILSFNIKYDDIVRKYLMSDISCPGGIFPDKINTFKIVNEYIEDILSSQILDFNISKNEIFKINKPKLSSYVISTFVFSFFFGLIVSIIMRSKNYF